MLIPCAIFLKKYDLLLTSEIVYIIYVIKFIDIFDLDTDGQHLENAIPMHK